LLQFFIQLIPLPSKLDLVLQLLPLDRLHPLQLPPLPLSQLLIPDIIPTQPNPFTPLLSQLTQSTLSPAITLNPLQLNPLPLHLSQLLSNQPVFNLPILILLQLQLNLPTTMAASFPPYQ
jgi:hypothetical protein